MFSRTVLVNGKWAGLLASQGLAKKRAETLKTTWKSVDES